MTTRALLCILLSLVIPAHASGLGGGSSFGDALYQQEPEFLKVDQAFIFTSEPEQNGLRYRWTIAEDYYLYLERFKFTSNNDQVVLGEPEFSKKGKAKDDPYFGRVHTFYDELEVFLPVSAPDGVSEAEVKVSYQGCAEAGLCYPPKKQTDLFIFAAGGAETLASAAATTTGSNTPPGAGGGTSATNNASAFQSNSMDDAGGIFNFIQNSSLLTIVGIFFALGIGLTFTPCVFPMIPIISSIIAGQESPTPMKSFILALSYVLGMAITYAAAGVITGLAGASFNIQAMLQSPVLISVFAVIFVLLAMAMFGMYELQLPAVIRDRLNTSSQKLNGGQLGSVFGIGALSALVVSPCVSAPLAGALLYISTTENAVIGGLSLLSMGLGMGVPLIAVAVGGGKLFPKAGGWMDTVKSVFGVMLLAVAIILLERILEPNVTLLLWALLIGVSAIQLGAFDAASPGWPRTFKGLGLFMAFYAALLTVGAFTNASSPFKPLEGINSGGMFAQATTATKQEKVAFNVIYDSIGLANELDSPDAKGKIVMLDFYADWCISCKVMENTVFPQPQIRSKLEQMHLVKADVTENSDANQELLNQFGLFGPPSILFFDENGREISELRVMGEISKNDLEKRLSFALSDNVSTGDNQVAQSF